MLTEQEANEMLNELKRINNPSSFSYPLHNSIAHMDLVGTESKQRYNVDVNRKGTLRISKYSYQTRANGNTILLRLDIDSPEHRNPDGTLLSRNHLHVYKEGCSDAWAIDIPACFVNIKDPIGTLINFLEYCKVDNYKALTLQGTVL